MSGFNLYSLMRLMYYFLKKKLINLDFNYGEIYIVLGFEKILVWMCIIRLFLGVYFIIK